MATVTLKGNSVTVAGNLPKKGEIVSDFSLTGKDLGDVSLFATRIFTASTKWTSRMVRSRA